MTDSCREIKAGQQECQLPNKKKIKCNRRDAEIAETDAEEDRFIFAALSILGVFLGDLGASAVAFCFVQSPSPFLSAKMPPEPTLCLSDSKFIATAPG
jgi:hypothetical protein